MILSWLETVLSHPLTPFALSLSTCVLVLAFASQNSPFRALGLLPMLGSVQLALRTIGTKTEITHSLHMSIFMSSNISMILQYLDSVLLSRWTYEAQGPTSALGGQKNLRTTRDVTQQELKPHASTLVRRLVFGWEEAFRPRSTRTPWEVNHVPKFFPDRPDMVPMRAQFIYWTGRRCLISFFIVDVISFIGRDATLNSVNFASDRIPFFTRLQDVTGQEVLLRFISSALHWATFGFLLQAMYDTLAVGAVVLDLGRIERWPPLFNRWTECWSVRQFWGSFWHQGTRQKFLAPANFLTFSIFRLSKGTLLARYVLLSFTFAVSGVFHQFGDVASGIPWNDAGAIRFFLMQAIGIIIEDTVQGIFRWFNGQQRIESSLSKWKRVLGFFWLLIWLTWTTPVWIYPVVQRLTGEGILPFSLLRSFIE